LQITSKVCGKYGIFVFCQRTGKEKERRMTDQELHINALHAAFIPLSREESRRKKQPELEGGSVNKFVEVVYMHLTAPSGLKEIVTGICLVA